MDDLEDGLYKKIGNKFEKMHVRKPDDDDEKNTMRPVRITNDSYNAIVKLQRQMRSEMSGYKPDISLVASALLNHISNDEKAVEIVKKEVQKMFGL